MATAQTPRHAIALSEIDVPVNVRELDENHVDALAGSIALQGVLVPVVVRPAGERFELVAGFHRLAAAEKAGLTEIPADVRDADTEHTDRAVENIVRKQLNAHEEARAVAAMLDRGLTQHGAAQALGWTKAHVTARVKILALPARAQELVGDGVIPLSAVDHLNAIRSVSADLLEAVIAFLDDGNEWVAERLPREPGWVLDAALRDGSTKAFAAYLHSIDGYAIEQLRLGKKTEALYTEAEKLHHQVDRYAYGPPRVEFTEGDVDQARAAGVLIEFEHGRPIIVDRSLYRELVKAAIARTVEDLRAKAEAAAAQKKVQGTLKAPADPTKEAQRARDAQLREIADQAHSANLDLGASLINGLSVVDPTSMDVARFFSYALLGADYDKSPYTQVGDRIAHIAAHGIRLVVGELRADVTKTKKDGTCGRLRIDYGDPRELEAGVKWLWRYVDGAKTAGELYGRTLVVLAAEQHAMRLVVPTSQRGYKTHWSSHRDLAEKALKKLAGPHVPPSLTKLERAVKRAHGEYDKAIADDRESSRQKNRRARASAEAEAAEGADEPSGEDLDDMEDLDPA